MIRIWVEINGQMVECMTTEEASKWLGRHTSTIRERRYKATLGAVRRGQDLWWPVDAVMEFDEHQFDRRRK